MADMDSHEVSSVFTKIILLVFVISFFCMLLWG